MEKGKVKRHKSNYARKSAYLQSQSRRAGFRVFGFEIPSPKPWKKGV